MTRNRRFILSAGVALAVAPVLARAAAYRQEFPYPRADVFAAVMAAMPDLKLKVSFADPALARVTAKAGMSAFSIGETLTIAVVDTGPARSALELDGTVGATAMNAFAHDRVLKHFNRIVAEVSRRLAAGSSEAPH